VLLALLPRDRAQRAGQRLRRRARDRAVRRDCV